MAQVHRNEGVAIHIGPESCAGGCEAVREALTGERVGQPLNRENDASRVPTFILCAEGNMSRRDSAIQMALLTTDLDMPDPLHRWFDDSNSK